MRAGPVLMSGPMVRSLFAGRKVQTRRIVKGEALNWLDGAQFDPAFVAHADNGLSPYGQPGDLLWVRETWALASRATDLSKVYYKAHENASHTEFHELVPTSLIGKHQPTWPRFKPSIHMPRWASRLTVELTEVRLERLQSISEADSIAEGIEPVYTGAGEQCGWLNYEHEDDGVGYCTNPVDSYASLWRTINGPGLWEANPWVWCLSFRVHRQNVDAFLAAKGAAA